MVSQAVILSRLEVTGSTVGPSAGAADEGKLVKLNSSGLIDASFIPGSPGVHSGLTGLGADDHLHYHNDTRGDLRYYTQAILSSTAAGEGASKVAIEDSGGYFTGATVELALAEIGSGAVGGTNDHGSLGGLADDDHGQYHNDTRGDARYHTQTLLASTAANEGASLIGVEDAAGKFTGTDVEAVLLELANSISVSTDHGSLGGLADDDHSSIYLSIPKLASTGVGQGASYIGVYDANGNYVSTDVEAALAEIWTLLASNSASEGASFIGIQDVGAYFTATNLEGALQEIGAGGTGVTDHGALTGLDDNDHSVVYHSKTVLASTSNGEGASLIGVEDAGGYFSGTTVEAVLQEMGSAGSGTSHASLTGLDQDDHDAVYYSHTDLNSTGATSGASLIGLYDTAGNYASTDVEAALAEVWTLLASVTTGQGAAFIGIEDAGTYFTSTTVEGALQELGAGGGGGVTDHGALTGLDDDDHDAIYYSHSDLNSTGATPGASLIGIYDTAGNYVSTDVEAALAEIWTELASTSASKGASYIGVQDSTDYYTATTVEGILAEIGTNTPIKIVNFLDLGDTQFGQLRASPIGHIDGTPGNAIVMLGLDADAGTANKSGQLHLVDYPELSTVVTLDSEYVNKLGLVIHRYNTTPGSGVEVALFNNAGDIQLYGPGANECKVQLYAEDSITFNIEGDEPSDGGIYLRMGHTNGNAYTDFHYYESSVGPSTAGFDWYVVEPASSTTISILQWDSSLRGFETFLSYFMVPDVSSLRGQNDRTVVGSGQASVLRCIDRAWGANSYHGGYFHGAMYHNSFKGLERFHQVHGGPSGDVWEGMGTQRFVMEQTQMDVVRLTFTKTVNASMTDSMASILSEVLTENYYPIEPFFSHIVGISARVESTNITVGTITVSLHMNTKGKQSGTQVVLNSSTQSAISQKDLDANPLFLYPYNSGSDGSLGEEGAAEIGASITSSADLAPDPIDIVIHVEVSV